MTGKHDVALDGARLGEVTEHDEGGWPTFEVTLTYHVHGTDDLDEANAAARSFFADATDWPEGADLS